MASSSSRISKKYDEFVELYEDISVGTYMSYDDHDNQRLIANDPRLLMLFEFFRHFYKRRKEVLKNVFPKSITDEFFQILEKMNPLLSLRRSNNKIKVEYPKLTRSLSVGSSRPRSLAGDDEDHRLRPDRFKIRTIVPAGSTAGNSLDSKSK